MHDFIKKIDPNFFTENTVQRLNISKTLTKKLSKICLWNINQNSVLGLKSNNLYCIFDIPKVLQKIISKVFLPKRFTSKVITFLNIINRKFYKLYIINELNKEIDFLKIIKLYFKNNNASIKKIDLDCYLNKPSNSAVIDWHRDAALNSSLKKNKKKFSSISVKIFIFLDPYINSDNNFSKLKKEDYPYLAVMSNTAKAVKIIDNLLIKNDLKSIGDNHNYQEMLALTNVLIGNNSIKLLKEERDSLVNLQNNLEEINKGDNAKHNNYGEPSTVVLFDDRNLHKGSQVKNFNRLVLRLMVRGKIR